MPELIEAEWWWCGYHRTHPMVSWDPAGTPYCWEGYWKGEVDECSSVPSITVRVHEAPPVPATQCVFPMVEECLLVYPTKTRVSYAGEAVENSLDTG